VSPLDLVRNKGGRSEAARIQLERPYNPASRPEAPEVRRTVVNRLNELRVLRNANGLLWATYFLVNRAAAAVAAFADARMQTREQRFRLPGINSVSRNRELWDRADWAQKGEQWSPSDEWKQGLASETFSKYVPANAVVLEIGPGAGRWSELLQPGARELVLVDISPRCLQLCRERFDGCTNVTYHMVQSPSLQMLSDASIDFMWSFDVFVHIAPADTTSYLNELARVMRRDAIGIIHHPGQGRTHGGYRSAVTAEWFIAAVKAAGLQFVRQFDSWGENGQFDVRLHRDAITVFRRP
jgi:SAM-dependent methyltransferase